MLRESLDRTEAKRIVDERIGEAIADLKVIREMLANDADVELHMHALQDMVNSIRYRASQLSEPQQ